MKTIKDKEAAETPKAEQNGTNGAASLPDHPLSRVIGGFADDPLWNEFIEEMEQSRREIDRKHGLVK